MLVLECIPMGFAFCAGDELRGARAHVLLLQPDRHEDPPAVGTAGHHPAGWFVGLCRLLIIITSSVTTLQVIKLLFLR